jgi:hypothetical protein
MLIMQARFLEMRPNLGISRGLLQSATYSMMWICAAGTMSRIAESAFIGISPQA